MPNSQPETGHSFALKDVPSTLMRQTLTHERNPRRADPPGRDSLRKLRHWRAQSPFGGLDARLLAAP